MNGTLWPTVARVSVQMLVLFLAGCGWHAVTGYGSGETFPSSADERVVVRTKAHVSLRAPFRNVPAYITCAEPSPDIARLVSETSAMKLSASVNLPGNIDPAVAYGYARGHAEGMAQLTDRLATTQILRDALYRACEAYANGAIDRVGYSLVLAHSERVMFGLLMAELISGRKAQPLAQIGVNASDTATMMHATLSLYEGDIAATRSAADQTALQLFQRLGAADKPLVARIRKLSGPASQGEHQAVRGLISNLSSSDRPMAMKLLGDVRDEAAAVQRREAVRGVFTALGAPPAPPVRTATPAKAVAAGQTSPANVPVPTLSDAASNGLVELARVQALQAMVTSLIEHPTLDGIEVACIAGAQAGSTVPDGVPIQELCRAALADIAVTKIVANNGDASNLLALTMRSREPSKQPASKAQMGAMGSATAQRASGALGQGR